MLILLLCLIILGLCSRDLLVIVLLGAAGLAILAILLNILDRAVRHGHLHKAQLISRTLCDYVARCAPC